MLFNLTFKNMFTVHLLRVKKHITKLQCSKFQFYRIYMHTWIYGYIYQNIKCSFSSCRDIDPFFVFFCSFKVLIAFINYKRSSQNNIKHSLSCKHPQSRGICYCSAKNSLCLLPHWSPLLLQPFFFTWMAPLHPSRFWTSEILSSFPN